MDPPVPIRPDASLPWAESLLAVTFDLEEGQVVELTEPANKYPEKLLKLIGYFSFPDSYVLTNEGDLFYCYQLKFDKEPLYCYSLYTQRKDPTNARGYFQKSIVLVSRHRLVRLFRVIVRELGKMFFNSTDSEAVLREFLTTINSNEQPSVLIRSGEPFSLKLPRSSPKVSFNRVLNTVR